jgi:hypothetical protein
MHVIRAEEATAGLITVHGVPTDPWTASDTTDGHPTADEPLPSGPDE